MKLRIDLADANARVVEIVGTAMLGGTVVITRKGTAVVHVTPVKLASRAPGTGKGVRMAPDFDAPLTDFAEYM